jgi:archaemetzincin
MKTFFLILVLITCISFVPIKKAKVIIIQPFGKFSNSESKIVFEKIKKIFPKVVLKKNISFPAKSFYKPRNRYRADLLIKFMSSSIGKDSVIIGLSNKDISTTNGKVKDWGVMGLGFCPGNACIVSSFRLSKNNKNAQFYKVALHELGHTQGLQHCKNKTCLMRDAKGGNPFNEEKDFCSSCKNYLKKKINFIRL